MSGAADVKADRKYTKDHEWARQDGADLVIGITSFAVEQLGDITLVNIDVKPGDTVTAGKTFGTIESVKTLSDLYAPVSGKVAKVNGELENQPELINEDPWQKGWMITITPATAGDTGELMDAGAYEKHVAESAH